VIQVQLLAQKVKMSMPQPAFYIFLVKFAEMLVSKPRNIHSETQLTIEHGLQKLVGRPMVCKDKMTGRTGGTEVKMNPTPGFISHHFECWQFLMTF
jgi:hypothetical protein